jgi:large-conductance mechanosensitive channel
MHLLLPLASILGIEVDVLIDRFRKKAVAWSVIGLFALIGLAFLLVAAHLALSDWVGPFWAALIMAGTALVIAAVIFLVIRVIEDIASRREAQRRHSAETTALMTTAAVAALPIVMKSPLMRTIGLPLGGALAALYFLSKPGERTGHRDE